MNTNSSDRSSQSVGVLPAVTEGASLSNAELADHVEVIAAGFSMPENPQAYRNTMRARLLEAASRLRAPAAAVPESPAAIKQPRPTLEDDEPPCSECGQRYCNGNCMGDGLMGGN